MSLRCRRFLLTALVASTATITVAATQIATVTPVAANSLQKLLPPIDGWTIGVSRADQIVLSPEAAYTFASVTLTRDEFRVRVQLSDTGRSPDSLTALAMIVVSMPADFLNEVDGTTIKRMQLGGSPAAELWNGAKGSGEITAVVGSRFVVSVDSTRVDSLDTLRSIAERVDLKALAALK